MSIDNLIENLAIIEDWIDNAPNPYDFKDNNEYMGFSTELMNYCLYLLKAGVVLAPNESSSHRGFTKHKAIIVGHMVRIMKLYEGFLSHIAERRGELATLFIRPIFETSIRMRYIINSKSKSKSIRSFILASYRPEKEILDDLNKLKKKRDLTKIEKRMVRKISKRLRNDRITKKELIANRRWSIDGKDFRSLLRALELERMYHYTFSNSSHYIHGDWHEIYYHHLTKSGRFYSPQPYYSDPDPRFSVPITGFCLSTLSLYIEWMKSDPDSIVLPIIKRLHKLNHHLDISHENTISD